MSDALAQVDSTTVSACNNWVSIAYYSLVLALARALK